SQRKIVIPIPMSLPFIFGAGNHPGVGTPNKWRVELKLKRTNSDTIPFQNKEKTSNPSVVPRERWVAPMTAPTPLLRYHAPAGGRLKSTPASSSAAWTRLDNLLTAPQARQRARSPATFRSAIGIS